ncbi:MAG: chemotaxis protein CheD [Planctomycetes bacterium]|nr:chemotaxis protein CheD [Planctomycetota bacterium]
MAKDVAKRDFMVEPGYVCMPVEPTRMAAVVASGIVVSIFDVRLRRGGMAHYVYPVRRAGLSTAMFACPAIIALLRMFGQAGSKTRDLQVKVYGGAENRKAEGFVPGLNDKNLRVGLEVLGRYGLKIVGRDVGGTCGRKIVFHSGTGETAIMVTDTIRASDWYPKLA